MKRPPRSVVIIRSEPAFGDGVVGDSGSALGGALALNYA